MGKGDSRKRAGKPSSKGWSTSSIAGLMVLPLVGCVCIAVYFQGGADSPAARRPAIRSPRSERAAAERAAGQAAASRTELTEAVLLKATEHIERWHHEVKCVAKDYTDQQPDCSPNTNGRRCARLVMDGLISADEAAAIVGLVRSGMSVARAAGGASILDLQTGAVSQDTQFIDVYRALDDKVGEMLPRKTIELYKSVTDRVKAVVEKEFNCSRLWLTSPTFFSKMDGAKRAVTQHDEYWHEHIDKLQYGSFDYTGLVYLNDHGTDYESGEFSFIDRKSRMTVQPRAGRLVLFTSGHENVHRVHEVTRGERFAATIAFTCRKAEAVENFLHRALA